MFASPASTLGFGWPTLAVALASAVAINLVSGPLVWLLYLPFLGAALHMTQRFRLFNTQRWRRVHARAMRHYAHLAGQAYDAARREEHDFDAGVPTRALARLMLTELAEADIDALLNQGRKPFFAGLVQASPQVFVQGIEPERHAEVLAGIRRDIEASVPGPDVVIARAVVHELGPLEAARYFHARLLGQVS